MSNLRLVHSTMKGKGWDIETIDGERCLYKKISPEIDVEVSGLKKDDISEVVVYVWLIHPYKKIVERFRNLPYLETLVDVLEDISKRYEELYENNVEYKMSACYKFMNEGNNYYNSQKDIGLKYTFLIDYIRKTNNNPLDLTLDELLTEYGEYLNE